MHIKADMTERFKGRPGDQLFPSHLIICKKSYVNRNICVETLPLKRGIISGDGPCTCLITSNASIKCNLLLSPWTILDRVIDKRYLIQSNIGDYFYHIHI